MRETGTLEECWLISELKAVVFLLALFTVLKYCLPNIEIKLMQPPHRNKGPKQQGTEWESQGIRNKEGESNSWYQMVLYKLMTYAKQVY